MNEGVVNIERAAFTIAVGKPIYLRMAFALARSFRLWNRADELPFFLATDAAAFTLPRDLADLNVISLQPGEYGRGFSPKLHLDKIAPAARSLFIDADCLCVGSLLAAFDAFRGRAVSVIGRPIANGKWFGDVAAICRKTGVAAMPRFNGGVYYLERGEICSKVYESARGLEKCYDEIGFERLRDFPNDEVLVSLAMAIHGQEPIPERGDIMNSLLAGPGGLELNVLRGHALLRNPRKHPNHNPWYEQEQLRPKVVHFLGAEIGSYPYRQEEKRLELVCGRGWPRWLAKVDAYATFTWPWQITRTVKGLLRPVYHALFGARAVKSERSF